MQQWQHVSSGTIYVMVPKHDWERVSETARRAAEILESNLKDDGTVDSKIIDDVLGILQGRW